MEKSRTNSLGTETSGAVGARHKVTLWILDIRTVTVSVVFEAMSTASGGVSIGREAWPQFLTDHQSIAITVRQAAAAAHAA